MLGLCVNNNIGMNCKYFCLRTNECVSSCAVIEVFKTLYHGSFKKARLFIGINWPLL